MQHTLQLISQGVLGNLWVGFWFFLAGHLTKKQPALKVGIDFVLLLVCWLIANLMLLLTVYIVRSFL